MTFSPIEKRLHDEETTSKLKKANAEHRRETGNSQPPKRQVRDVEKGVPDVAVKDGRSSDDVRNPLARRESKSRPRLPNVKIPSSAFEMDSPKTPVWKKVFGR